MDTEERFEEAVGQSRSLPDQPNEVLLELYAMYKQATSGDASGAGPGLFDPVGSAKFQAWKTNVGMSRDEAMVAYADLVKNLSA